MNLWHMNTIDASPSDGESGQSGEVFNNVCVRIEREKQIIGVRKEPSRENMEASIRDVPHAPSDASKPKLTAPAPTPALGPPDSSDLNAPASGHGTAMTITEPLAIDDHADVQ